MAKTFAELHTCERCGHGLAPNDWIGVCSLTMETGCRWCLEREPGSIGLGGKQTEEGRRGIVRYAEDGVTEILAERE